MANDYRRLTRYIAATLVALLAVGILAYYTIFVFNVLPIKFATLAVIAVALVAGYLAIRILSKEIRIVASKLLGTKKANNISVAFEYIGYIVLAIVVLGLAGVSGNALLAGGTFAGLVLGLAGQTVISNVLAGILLITARPMEIGDRVTIATWQYGMVVPVYPPKFFSDDRLIVGYTGVIKDIGLTYCVLTLDEGPTVKIPNNVIIQAAVIRHGLNERLVRVRYQAPASIPLDVLIPAIQEGIKKNEWVSRQDSVAVYVQNVTNDSFVLAIDAVCKGEFEDPPRSSIYIDTWKIVKALSSTA
ncbi:MAG: mechanosensitive ion channel family protein [Nitrososphaerota archaeon]